MSAAGCRLLMVRVLFELKAKTGVQPHLYEGPISRSVCSYIHGLYIFIPICGLFCICKKQQKNMCVKSSVPPLFLVKRKNAQAPFFSLGKNIRFRQAIFSSCPPGCANGTANL